MKVSPIPEILPSKAKNKKRKKTSAERNADALYAEHLLYQSYLRDHPRVPKIPDGAYGEDKGYRFLVLERLGRTLETVLQEEGPIPSATAARLGLELIDTLKHMHVNNIVYVDVKPENFMLDADRENKIYVVDFGISDRYVMATGKHKEHKMGNIVGTPTFLSLNCHAGATPSRRDDIEALLYVLLYLMLGSLPWQKVLSDAEGAKLKKATSVDQLCQTLPQEWKLMLQKIRACKFDEKPDYDFFTKQFVKLDAKPGSSDAYNWGDKASKKDAEAADKSPTTSPPKKKTKQDPVPSTANGKVRTTSAAAASKRAGSAKKVADSKAKGEEDDDPEVVMEVTDDPRRRRKAAHRAVAGAAAADAAAKLAENLSTRVLRSARSQRLFGCGMVNSAFSDSPQQQRGENGDDGGSCDSFRAQTRAQSPRVGSFRERKVTMRGAKVRDGSRSAARNGVFDSAGMKRADVRIKHQAFPDDNAADSLGPPLNASRVHTPLKHEALAGDPDDGGVMMVFGGDEDGNEVPVRHRKKRSRPQSHLQQGESADDRRCAHFTLHGSALDQFQSWIKNSDAEPPPVRGAGAAKRIPDSELLMFKDSRIVQDTKTPQIFPSDEDKEIRKRVMQQLSPQQSTHRPRSWELSSPPHKKSTRQSMDTILREQLTAAAEDDMRHTLPLLTRPTHQTVRRDKAAMLQLLAECRVVAFCLHCLPVGRLALVLPFAQEGVATSPTLPNHPGSSRNQRSRGGGNELPRKASDLVMTTPDSVFYATNSFSPLDKIDLSDWTCFCSDVNPAIVSQIRSKLSSRCVELNLSGLTALTAPQGFQTLLQNCGKLKRLVLSECENIHTAGFCAIAQSCPLVESLDLSESESVTDNVLHCVLSSFQNLARIKLNGCPQITDTGVLLLSAKKHKIHALEGIYLDRCHLVSSVSLLPLIKAHGATLQAFSIRGCRRVSDTVVKELFISHPKKLQELNLSDCTSLTDACMEYLSTVPSYFGDRVATAYHHLVKMDVSGCMVFTSLVCCWIAASAPFLQSLKAARCTGFCGKGVLTLASLAHLEEIDFTGCSQISESGMERMFLSDGRTKPGSSVTAKQHVVDSVVVKKIKKLMMADCPNQGERCALATVSSCSKTLVELNLSNIAPLPAKTLIKLVKHCRATTELHVQRQPAVTRPVLAHLASCNKHLRVLDLRHCVNVDDLAIYPLLVMQSLEELYFNFHREKASVWNTWLEFVHRQKANKRALLRFSNKIQVKCWFKWRQFHDEVQKLKRVSGRSQSRRNVRMRRALAFFSNGTMVRVFSAWAGHTECMKAFRTRTKARMENENLAFAITSWITFTRLRRELHATATKLQAFWRGCASRRRIEDEYLCRIWATVLIQTAWRGRLGRIIMRAATRKARLREYLRAERERDAMDAKETSMRKFNNDIEMIILLQRQWRGVAARTLFAEIRRARYILEKQQEAEMQEIVRAEARKRQLDRIQHEKRRQLAAIEIQRHIRGYLGRKWYRSQQEFLHEQRAALRVQAVYRGRMSRWRTSALRRSYIARMEILARRAVEGKVLRTLGAKTRSTQRGLRSFLDFFGLDPATFLTDIRAVFKEVREDFQTMKEFFDVIKTKVHANAAKNATTAALPPPAAGSTTVTGKPMRLLQKTNAAKKFLSDFERIVDITTAGKEKKDQVITPGMAVRIVLRGHPRCGETAFVLGVKEEVAQVKMDVDGYLEFFPLMLPATKVKPARCVLHRVPELAFTAAHTNTMANGKISERWRQQLEAYAASIAEESKRYCAARVIQCAARVYLSRMRCQLELEAQGVNAARRQKALLRVLKTFHGANTRIPNILVQLRFVHALNLPPNLPDEPLEIQKVLNRFQRWLGRRAEIQHAFLRLVPEEFKGDGQFHGQMMSVPYTRVFDKLLHYPIQWLKRATCVPVARQLEKRGLAELAAFIGGSEFVKTFEEMHTDAREHCFPQLQNCSFCASEGWALVHGVFQKRKVAIEHPSLQNLSKKKKYVTKLVPHGWGVAHFLTGQVGKSRNWLARNSIEAQFKSLQIVKAMKQKEREERLESQILARQGTMNTLRSAEGARGFAKRHAELSVLEEDTKALYQRFVDEIVLCEKEEAKIFEEEQRVNELIAKENLELERQGIHLNALQQQVPEIVVEIEMIRSSKSALEFLTPGCVVEVEYDDEVWYQCQIVNIDPYDTYMADIVYVEDQRKEKIKLLEVSSLDEKLFQRKGGTNMKPKTVTEITATAAAELEAQEVPFRRWRAGNAVEISWEPPFDNGTPITQYALEWKDENDEAITGKKDIAGHSAIANDSDEKTPRTVNAHIPTKTTLWPIPEESALTLRVRIAAANKKGVGLASVYSSLPEELTEVSYRTAIPLTRPPEDTAHLETREMSDMEFEDKVSLEHRRRLACTICQGNLPTEAQVHEHVVRAHSVPLLCPFKSCRQVCGSEKALRYHIWRCTIPKPTNEELQSELFMEIFNISRQYCMRKPRRHILPVHSACHTENGTTGEEVYLENKYQDARRAWFEKGKELHEKNLEKDATARRRERENRYDPPRELYGLDFASSELNVARRNAVLNTIQILQTDLDAYIAETNTQMDQLKHEEKELLEYIALKREKKKAQKSLDQVQEKITILTVTSTQRIEEMTTEIQRLTTIEKATNYGNSCCVHREVGKLEAWDAMVEARRRQLQTLKDELRQLQLVHTAEIQSYMQKRDEGDEALALRKLRDQQIRVITRQERAAQQLLEKQTRLQAAANALEAQQSPEPASLELTTTIKSLHIVNHDLELHEKFIKGKSEDVEYLKEEPSKAGTSDRMVKGKLLDTVADEVAATSPEKPAAGQATGEQQHSLPLVDVTGGSGEATTTDPTLVESPQKLAKKKTKKHSRMKLQELPHMYTRLECDFQDGFIRGHVRIEYNDGSVYEGPWVGDVNYNKPSDMEPMKTKFSPNHWGKFTSRDGTIWEGEDVDNFFSPFTATGENFHVATRENNKYIGAMRAGKYHGFGTLHMSFVFSKGEYVGEWCESKRHGYGIERFDGGEIYEGYWEMDVYHGEGEIVYDDSSRYEGSFRYGKWHGEGVRTLENGDRIVGHFHEGLLNGPGIKEFADKRHYHGSFKNTRRHGLRVLTFPNGDRYEGPFENDLPHGEGKFITKSAPGENGSREPLVRMGKWLNGERTAWLSKPSTELATSTFIQYFAVQQNLTGEMEINLVLSKFKTPYAVMVASMLPNLPEGVNADDAFVKVIVKMLAKTQNIMVGNDILDKTIAEHTQVKHELDNEVEAFESLRNEVDAIERTYRVQQRTVNERQQEYDTMTAKELEMQVKVETFWKQKDHAQLENNYKRAVEGLHDVDIMDWFKLRAARLDAVYLSFLDAFAVLLHFTDNAYLGGKMYTPTKEDLMQLLSSSNENVFLGDKEALIHKYDVKALYVLPLFDVYSFGEGTRNAMLNNLTHAIHHPRLRPNNFRLNQISPAATAVCTWVRAAFFYAKKAVEIYPVVKRVLDQLIIAARLRESLASENVELETERQRVEIARLQLADQIVRVEELRRHEQELQKVIEGIDELDRGEHERIEKQHVKRLQMYRPPSAGINAARPGGTEDKGEQGPKDHPSQHAAPQAQVNHRQVFEEDHDTDAEAK
ncbi:Leucine rich repeat protein, partial [Globisporangium splendens]